MRRILTTALASALLALALPAAASAHHGSRHDRARRAEARHHHRHHHHARTVVFARPSTTAPSNGTPSQPTQAVATIASFENGVLKITLADGSTVAGKVTEMTEIECGGGCSGHHDFGDGSPGRQHDDGDDDGDHHGFFHDDEQGPQNEGSCGVSSLVAGAKVEEAELHVSGAGAFWEKVELLPKEEKA